MTYISVIHFLICHFALFAFLRHVKSETFKLTQNSKDAIPKHLEGISLGNIPSEVDKATSIVDANVHIEDNSDLMSNKELSTLAFVHTVHIVKTIINSSQLMTIIEP